MPRKIPYRGGAPPAGGNRANAMPAMGGLNPAMMGQIQKMQQQLMEAQESLSKELVEASAGGGAVTLTMTGQQIVQSIKLNPEVLNPDDAEMLQDMLVSVFNDAVEKSRKLAEERMGPLAGGLKGMGLF
jgi:DNA-binding YbaB/EbfC family protein